MGAVGEGGLTAESEERLYPAGEEPKQDKAEQATPPQRKSTALLIVIDALEELECDVQADILDAVQRFYGLHRR